MVPLRVIAETLNATVSYDQQHNYAIITTTNGNQAVNPTSTVDGQYLGLPTVGVMVNGQVLTGGVPPVLLKDRTLVPVRLAAEALGCTVNYSDDQVSITSPSNNTAGNSGSLDNNLATALQNDSDAPANNVTRDADLNNNIDNTLNYSDQNIDSGQ